MQNVAVLRWPFTGAKVDELVTSSEKQILPACQSFIKIYRKLFDHVAQRHTEKHSDQKQKSVTA